jgi:multidrug efflux pump subunit AcrA (membrane-fusion protein)
MKLRAIILLFFVLISVSCVKKTQETKPIRKDVTETVFASGILEANGTYQLTAQNDGYLVAVNFQENDIIQEGAVLAVIDNKQNVLNTESAEALYQIAKNNTNTNAPNFMQAKNSSLQAKQKMELDSIQVGRYKKLFESNSIAKTEYENVLLQYQNSKGNYANSLENYRQLKQQAEQQLIINASQSNVNKVLTSYNQIRVVFTGKVYQKFKQKGDFVRKGDIIAKIGDANVIYAKISIDESNIRKIKIGQEAVIQLNTNKEKVYKGQIAEILPSFDEATQSFTCKVTFIDKLDFTIVNTQLQANIIIGVNKNALLIPRNYLSFGNYVTVKGNTQPVQVKTHFVSSEWVQIDAGIDENTTLITDNPKL